MPNVKFVEFEAEIEIEDDNGEIGIFSQIKNQLEFGKKQMKDLKENFNPIIRVPIYVQLNFETGKIIDFGIYSCADSPNHVTPLTQEDFKRLIGQ